MGAVVVTGRRIADVILVTAGALVLVAGIAIRVNDLHLQTVLTGSMTPAVSPGDVAITQPVPVSVLRAGDVVAFYPPDKDVPVLHRIVSIEDKDGAVSITTKGDANSVTDPWTATLQGDTANRMVGYVPLIGWLPQYRGLLFLAAGLLFGFTLVRGLLKEVRHRRPGPA